MAAILNSAILNLAILDSAILVFPLKLTHTCQDWFPPFAQKKLHSHFPPHHLHKKNLKALDFSMNRIDLILLTQAFASPTDMASSGVKENIILTTTPT